jgi:hypothetical protein
MRLVKEMDMDKAPVGDDSAEHSLLAEAEPAEKRMECGPAVT